MFASPDIFDEYTRRQYLAKAPARNPFGVDEEPKKFAEFDVFTKLRVLVQLSQWTLINAERMRERMPEVKDTEQIQWVCTYNCCASRVVKPQSKLTWCSVSKKLATTSRSDSTLYWTTTGSIVVPILQRLLHQRLNQRATQRRAGQPLARANEERL